MGIAGLYMECLYNTTWDVKNFPFYVHVESVTWYEGTLTLACFGGSMGVLNAYCFTGSCYVRVFHFPHNA
jgi:hypothetical protein